MPEFAFTELLPLGPDTTEYRLLSTDGVSTIDTPAGTFLRVAPEALTLLTETAMRDIAHLLRPAHLQQLRNILDDPEASDNDRFVALDLLKNANIAAGGVLPMCQDTGTAIVKAKKGQYVLTGGGDEEAIARGVYNTFLTSNLRYSQMAPISMYEERNTGNNLPAEIKIAAVDGDAYKFLFIAKGGGSANKSYLFQETKALLNEKTLLPWLFEKMKTLGTAACPPYHLAVVIGGTSAEYAVETAKLASTKYLDSLPMTGSIDGHAFRDIELEAKVLALSQQTGIGAQFGGKYFCHDVRVIRLPRHGASCPVAMAVSCSADRQALGKITADGVFLEQLETDPARFLPEVTDEHLATEAVSHRPEPADGRDPRRAEQVPGQDPHHAHRADGRGPRHRPRQDQGAPRRGARVAAVHEGLLRLLRRSGEDPRGHGQRLVRADHGRADGQLRRRVPGGWWQLRHARQGQPQPAGHRCLQDVRRLLPRLDRRTRRPAWRRTASPRSTCSSMPELGMEAIWKIEVRDFPAFIVVDDKGNDFFDLVNQAAGTPVALS